MSKIPRNCKSINKYSNTAAAIAVTTTTSRPTTTNTTTTITTTTTIIAALFYCCCYCYEGRSINKLQNGIILLMFII